MKKECGITLIALVITIIVLLILAGVSITVALDPNNGLFTRANKASEATRVGAIKEALNNAGVENTMESVLNGTVKTPEQIIADLTSQGLIKPEEVSSNAEGKPIITIGETVIDVEKELGESTPAAVPPLTQITASNVTVEKGQTAQITVTKTPSGATEGLTYTSNDNTVATVDENGVVTGVKEGTATITITGKTTTSVSTTCTVIVNEATHTVTYNANGGEGTTLAQTSTYNSTIKLNTCSFTKTDYAFVEWNTKADGTGTSYVAGSDFTLTQNITLYAIWQIDYIEWMDRTSYTNGINSSEGTFNIGGSTVTFNVSGEGYTFTVTGAANGVGITITGQDSNGNTTCTISSTGQPYPSLVTTNDTTKVVISGYGSGKVTLKNGDACEIIDSIPNYTVTFYMNDGTQNIYETKLVKKWTLFNTPSTSPTRAGYTFKGWHGAPNVTSGAYPTGSTIGYATTDVSFYAIWELN